MKPLIKQLFWFVLVGSSAALVHWLVVVWLVSNVAMAPLIANVIGWLVAFIVSFSGHYHLTFRHSGARARAAMLRFFLLSGAGFLINETSYAILLSTTQINYQWLLAGILIAVAGLTFVVSKFWAFRPTRTTRG